MQRGLTLVVDARVELVQALLGFGATVLAWLGSRIALGGAPQSVVGSAQGCREGFHPLYFG